MAAEKDNLVYDFTSAYSSGMNSGELPRLLPPNQASFAFNATFRGGFPTDRPKVRKINLTFDAGLQPVVESGLYQGAGYFKPDNGSQSLLASISGRLFQFTPDTSGNATVSEKTIPGDPNPSGNPQAWFWQSESWMIWTDGTMLPVFFDGSAIRRSNGPAINLGITNGAFTVPAVDSNVTITLVANYTGPLNVVVNLSNTSSTFGNYLVISSGTPPVGQVGYVANLKNENDTPGNIIPVGTPVIIPGQTNVLTTTTAAFNVPSTGAGSFVKIYIASAVSPAHGNGFTIAGRGYTIQSQSVDSGGPFAITQCNNPRAPGSPAIVVPSGTTVYDPSINPSPSYTVGTISVAYTVPAVGVTSSVQLSNLWTSVNPNEVTINGKNYALFSVAQTVTPSQTLVLKNLSDTVGSNRVTALSVITIPELPIGRMGVYGEGRNWMSLIDGISFTASDLVGESSGSSAYNFRDAVLKTTKNASLTNGKPFRVPNAGETIQGMSFIAQLDVALGQGPLQIFTDLNVFSCQAPIDSSIWASLTTPIVAESLKGSGGTSQESIVNSNAEILFRCPNSDLRSFLIARLDFNKWGNTPISHEMQRVLSLETPALTNRCSGVEFDNRLLQTVNPIQGNQGVYHRGLMVINFDEISSLSGKSPSIWEGLWTGLQIFRIITGKFFGVDRCFAFCFESVTNKIELWEILPDDVSIVDDLSTPVIWGFETPDLFRGIKGELIREFKSLEDGEISLDDVQGDVTVEVFYRPDQYPGWVLWKKVQVSVDMTAPNSQPGYFPRLGLGRPDSTVCNSDTGQSMRYGYTFQTRKVIQGHCRCLGDRYAASIQPQPKFAQISCDVKRIGIPVPPLDDFAIYNVNSGETALLT